MAVRTFTDDDGNRWRVWETLPSFRELVAEELRAGWLTFERQGERRRLAPIPANWDKMSDVALRLAVRAAAVIRRERGAESPEPNP